MPRGSAASAAIPRFPAAADDRAHPAEVHVVMAPVPRPAPTGWATPTGEVARGLRSEDVLENGVLAAATRRRAVRRPLVLAPPAAPTVPPAGPRVGIPAGAAVALAVEIPTVGADHGVTVGVAEAEPAGG